MKTITNVQEGLDMITKDLHTYRLHFHLMPPTGWMNDPNGLSYFNGEYHVFYQHYPFDPKWGPMHWGHAVSRDLLHFTDLPVALFPDKSYDEGGCFSGSAVVSDGELYLFYTGHVDGRSPKEVQCLATSTDGIVFTKHAANPVIPGPPLEGSADFRDPKVWKSGDTWYMLVGSEKNGLGRVLLYTSKDGVTWSFSHVLLSAQAGEGEMWECPDLFVVDGRHVLILSRVRDGGHEVVYYIGDWPHARAPFEVHHVGYLDYGSHFYAPQTFVGASHERILLGWMDRWNAPMPSQQAGWAGALTVPRVLRLTDDGTRLGMIPMPGIEAAFEPVFAWDRESGRDFENGFASDGVELGEAYALDVYLDAKEIGRMGKSQISLVTHASSGEDQQVLVTLDFDQLVASTDTRAASMGVEGAVYPSPVPASWRTKSIRVRVFVDTSSVEVFAGDGSLTWTHRMYPSSGKRSVRLQDEAGWITRVVVSRWIEENKN